jgi:protein-S-isoprenylcysteine O-methyltransferase Ste14
MVAVLLFCRPQPDGSDLLGLLRIVCGWSILFFGLFMRVWGVACWFTRNREGVIGGKRLMTEDGPYPYTRNPRYLGNFCMGLGASILAGVPWIPLAYVLLWCAVHLPIVNAERDTLLGSHGPSYEAYCRRVPALIPRLDPAFPFVPQVLFVNWRGGIREEIGTLSGWLSIALFLHFWRAAHFVGWQRFGPHWLFIVLVVGVVMLGEKVRRALPLEQVERAEDRPIRP